MNHAHSFLLLLTVCSVSASALAAPAAATPTPGTGSSDAAPPYPAAQTSPAVVLPAAYYGSTYSSYRYPAADAKPEAKPATARKGDNFTARPLAVFGHASLGGPYGVLGASLDYSPSRYLSVEAGGGMGYLKVPEVGAMLLPRLPLSRGFAVGAGVGMSAWVGGRTPADWAFEPFANGELYLEGRTESGFSVRGYAGEWTLPLSQTRYLSLPYVGVAFGWAL